MKRRIIEIDEKLCDGCGKCVLACLEGAIAIVDGKAKLVSESLCDGAGACIGECPKGALRLVEKEVEDHTIFESAKKEQSQSICECTEETFKSLSNWPIKLRLVTPKGLKIDGQGIVLCADCVGYAYPDLHEKIIKGKKFIIGCPKLEPTDLNIKKLSEIITSGKPSEILLCVMEIPCCRSFLNILNNALKLSGMNVPLKVITIGMDGKVKSEN